MALETSVPLALLFDRLRWPVPLARWRAATGVKRLLEDPTTRQQTTAMFLDRLELADNEIEVCELLNIILLTNEGARPKRSAIAARIAYPSILVPDQRP